MSDQSDKNQIERLRALLHGILNGDKKAEEEARELLYGSTSTEVAVGSERVRMIPVKSSNVKAVGYTRDSRSLLVQFSDSYYRYEDVGPEKFVALMQGPSVGKYLSSQIKGVHKYTKVDAKPV